MFLYQRLDTIAKILQNISKKKDLENSLVHELKLCQLHVQRFVIKSKRKYV